LLALVLGPFSMLAVAWGDNSGETATTEVTGAATTESPGGQAAWPTAGWQSAPAEEAGFRSDELAEGLLAIREEGVPIHSLTIVRHGSTVADAYFYPYDGSTVHDMASVTKSVMTTLIGIAADQGVLDVDDPMVSFFPDRSIASLDGRKERITVAHLASMSSGLECTETNEQTQQEMMATSDWVQFALDLPVAWEPGTQFVYCNPAIHLLSAILQQATGMTALEFAEVNLFEPLGIDDAEWDADPQGFNHGWGDLFLRPEDAAKLGFLWLHRGQWEDRQIVSPEWVAAASQRLMTETAGRGEDYGYGWWISAEDEPLQYVRASGVGGQNIYVYPAVDMVLVTTGDGFEMDQIEPHLVAAIGGFEQPLPADPAGVAALEDAVQSVVQPLPASPVAPLPAVASAISGTTFVFEAGSPIEWIRLDFGVGTEATLRVAIAGEDVPRVLPVGLDGIYREAVAGPPGLARGQWEDDQTFVVDYSTLPNVEHFTLRFTFQDERVALRIDERVYATSTTLEGTIQDR
jgi:CubicO group peptidase (beta-lactamase class C family)